MELYLDSADFKEIEQAFKLGFLTGLTTTPTFMVRHGITDIDAEIIKLSKIVPILQIEALGENAEEIVAEAERQMALGLDIKKTVFKIPVSLEGVRACKMLRDKGMMVNIHLVYTLNQAYMAMAAGASYVCPLVGRLQDQGHDAIALIEDCVEAVNYYQYDTKIMFSSVRHPEHVRTAFNAGAHTITIPWSVMKMLTQNNFTTLGTDQFIKDTQLMTMRAKQVMNHENPTISLDETVFQALAIMTNSGTGAVSIVNSQKELKGIFTDGDLRRSLSNQSQDTMNRKMSEFVSDKLPITVEANALLMDVVKTFKDTQVDNLIVVDGGKPLGMIDIQDCIKMGLII